ncbi:MAG: hypothetical protein BWY58_00051 [Chloroflexi bacterium ADurb.Bin344]|nr:MAG: hypothetical protein BWY58_00051 [Chloroflexi bacterium ADurb.Bin344]
MRLGKTIILKIFCFICAIVMSAQFSYGASSEIMKSESPAELYQIASSPYSSRDDIYLLVSRLEYLGKNDPQSFFILARLYKEDKLYRQGMLKMTSDERQKKMIYYFQLAAQNNHVPSILTLASIYDKGIGVSASQDMAMELWLKAAELKSDTALDELRRRQASGFTFSSSELQKRLLNTLGIYDIKETRSATVAESVASATTKKSSFQAISHEFRSNFATYKLFWIPVLVLGIWGIIGVSLGLGGKIYLYNNIPDIVLSAIVSPFFFGLLVVLTQDNAGHDMRVLWVFFGIILLIFLILMPTSLRANPEKFWALPLVIPGKIFVVFILLASAFAAIANIAKVITEKKDRLSNGIAAATNLGMTYGLYKIIQKTTRH